VDKNLGPVGGLKSEDAREALANIHSLDRDEWAAAWSAIGERYDKRAKSEELPKTPARRETITSWRSATTPRPAGPYRIHRANRKPIRTL